MEVGLYQPGLAILIVFEKFPIARRFHFVSPHDLGVINVRVVINPFIHRVMAFPISDHNKLLARKAS